MVVVDCLQRYLALRAIHPSIQYQIPTFPFDVFEHRHSTRMATPDAEARLDTSTSEGEASQPNQLEWTGSISALSLSPNAHMQHTELFIHAIALTPAQQHQRLQQQAMSDDAIARHTDMSQARSTPVSANEINIKNITPPAPAEETTRIYPPSAAASATASQSNVTVAKGPYSVEACFEEELYGPTAKSEEDLALQVGLELAARRKQIIQPSIHTSTSLSSGMSSGSSERDLEGNDEDEDHLEHNLDDEEKDNCLSGICLPSSQFFQTSVICSNTMTRDGLGKVSTAPYILGVLKGFEENILLQLTKKTDSILTLFPPPFATLSITNVQIQPTNAHSSRG